MKTFHLPDLGEGLMEAEIVEWHVAVGDEVKADQPLVSVETAKAIVEVPSPRAGRIVALYGAPGDVIHTHDPLVEFEQGGEDAGAIVGELGKRAVAVAERPLELGRAAGTVGIKATPAVRALAARLDVDLGAVTPSGPDGLITAADVQRAAKVLAEAGPLEPLRGPRRAMARAMAQAHAEVVPVTVTDEADVEGWPAGTDITLRLLRAIVAGVRAEPGLNAWFDSHALGRRVLARIDVGIAVDTPEGLFVPVMRNVAERSSESLRAGLEALKAAVKSRQIPPEELRGCTITLSNFGMIAGRFATPVVLPPTVAILGAGRIRAQVVAASGAAAVHRVLPLSLTFDHRAATGGEAGRFLAAAIADLELGQ